MREPVTSGQATGAGGVAGMKRPQTVIGLAPPPVGAPRPGQAGARVPLPSGKGPSPASAPRPAVGAAAGEKPAPPSSGRGVKPPALPPSSPGSAPTGKNDADATDEQFAVHHRDSIPDSQKEEMATMAKSAEESLALFGLDAGLTDAARAAVPLKPTPAAGAPAPPSNRSPLASTNLAAPGKPLGPAPKPMPMSPPDNGIALLHDRTEEEESTRAVSREEMMRGHEAVVIGDDVDAAQGEDATLAVAPGFNENAKHLHQLQQQLANEQNAAPPGFDQPPPQGFHPPTMQSQQGWNQPQPAQQGWQDPNAPYGQQAPQSYPNMAVGPVSGPHLPAQSWTPNPPPSQPHFPGGSYVPQSQPMQLPPSGQMMAAGNQQPIPYPGQTIHQPQQNPFGDWNANAPGRKKFQLSGQILLLGIVGAVCLAIFITGIVLFATTKF